MRLIYLQSFACCLLLAFSAPAFGQAAPPPGGDDAAASEDEEEEDIGEEDDLLLEIEKEFEQTEPTPGWEAAAEEVHTFPWVEHHGYFRFRPDLLFNGHLGTHTNAGLGETVGTSGVPAPLTENVENNDPNLPEVFRDRVGAQGDDTLAGANMRFRYTPTVHVSSELRIGLQLDIFDNLVLGSTPDFHPTRRPDAPLVAFAGSQQSPEAGLNSSRDAVRVKQVYGEWLSPLGLLRVGRQASHWGLGILANGGQDFDSDFGDFVDRALLLTRVPGADLYLTLAWDYVAAGKISDDAADYFGQPYDLSEQDDVREYVVALFDKSLSPKEKAQRHHRLNVLRKPVLEWGLYYVYRAQDLDVLVRDPDADPLHTLGYDDVSLVTRDAYAHIPDLWLRLDWAPAPGQLFHFEAEGAAIIGEIGNVLNDPSSG